MKGIFLVAVASVLTWQSAFAEDQYLCIPDYTTGFAFGSDGWHPTTFRVTEKYLVRRTKESDKAGKWKWLVFEVGKQYPLTYCADDFSDGGGGLHCPGTTEWWMNNQSLRFMTAYLVGYVGGTDGKDTPALTIGKCTVL